MKYWKCKSCSTEREYDYKKDDKILLKVCWCQKNMEVVEE